MFFPIQVKPAAQHCQSKLEDEKGMENNFTWSLEPITKFMGFVGIYPPTNGRCSCVKHIHRVFSFLLVASIQPCVVILFFQNKNLISNAYVTGTSTSALSWNFIIDYLNMVIYTIGGRCFLSLVTRPKTWMDLVKSFQLLEENLPSPEIYAESRRVGVKAIIYITVSVRK